MPLLLNLTYRRNVMTHREMTVEEQLLHADCHKFARLHVLTASESMMLPALFRKGAAATEETLSAFADKALEIKELGDYVADMARRLAATEDGKKLYEEFLREGAA
jgi:ABC-type branched-subunit amino acid transport system ATPase component